MSKWIFVSVVCLTCLAFLASSPIPLQIRPTLAAAPDPFVADPPSVVNSASPQADAAQTLDRLLAALGDVAWLRVVTWQRLHDPDHGYESTSHLQLGPDCCARLETNLRTGSIKCQRLVISDGHALAEVFCHAGDPDKVTANRLPERSNVAGREHWLRDKGCVGPLPVLAELRAIVPVWKVQPGTWRQHRVLRFEGHIDRNHPKVLARPTFAACSARLYLEASTLWPVRIEWWAGDDLRDSRLHLEMEYREPQVNQPLSAEECTRAFTYQPAP